MFEHLAPVIERRLEIRGQEGPDKPVKRLPPKEDDMLIIPQIDCMQYLIDTSPRKTPWSVQRTIGEIMAVWFSSVHQLAMVRPSQNSSKHVANVGFRPLRSPSRIFVYILNLSKP